MPTLLMKWIAIVSAIWSVCTCLAILAQTIDESFLPVPLLICRLLGTLLATSQFVSSILIYFKLKQRPKLLWRPFYMFTVTAFCTTVNYIVYTSLRSKYCSQDNNDPNLDVSIIDTCMAFDFLIIIIFHLVIIFDCDDDEEDDTNSSNHHTQSAIPYQIFTVEVHASKS